MRNVRRVSKQVFARRRHLRFHPSVQRTGGWIKRWLQDLTGAGLAITVGWLALTARPLADWIAAWSYDLPYCLRSDAEADGVIVVAMDTASMAALGQDNVAGWSRQLHATLVDRLLARGAQAVVFTPVFSQPSASNAVDRAFAQALRRARGRVVLAAGFTNGAVVKPIAELAAAAPWGLLCAPVDGDTVARRQGSSPDRPAAAARVASVLGKASPVAEGMHWLNHYSSTFTLPEVSYERALRGTEPAGFFKGKIVIVCPTEMDGARFATPYTRWTGRRATLAELEATAILNLTRRDWLSRLPAPVESGIVIVAGFILGLAFMGMRRWTACLLAIGTALLVGAANFLLFSELHCWFPWLAVSAVQIPFAFGWAWLCDELDRPRLPRPVTAPPSSSIAAPGASTTTPKSQTAPPAVGAFHIPDHQLLRCIGRGAYGEVWLVRDVIGRHQAVKIVQARSFPEPAPYEREFKGIERFAAVSRNHPGLVQVLHVGRNDANGYFFYIMELADDAGGAAPFTPDRYSPKTLASELTRRGHLPVKESIEIGLTLCSALQHLHERQLVHRDIKPSNIIFVEGRVKIADIGLVAQINTTGDALTRLGTDGYLAPEGPGTPQADLYALGKVLYEISMGRDRWQFPEFPTTIGARPDQDDLRRLHEIILTACEDDPALRYPSAAAMHAALAGLRTS